MAHFIDLALMIHTTKKQPAELPQQAVLICSFFRRQVFLVSVFLGSSFLASCARSTTGRGKARWV
jgi:hypothetical protein